MINITKHSGFIEPSAGIAKKGFAIRKVAKLEQDFGPYRKGNFWVEPSVSHALELIKFVVRAKTNKESKLSLLSGNMIRNSLRKEKIGEMVSTRINYITRNIV